MSEGAGGTFSGRGVAGLLAIGLICFSAFVVLLAFSGGPDDGDGQGHAASRSAVGFAGIVQLLRATGTVVSLRRGAVDERPAGMLVVTPRPGTRGPATMPVLDARTVLIVLPKWRVSPVRDHRGWVEQDGLLGTSQVFSTLPGDWERPALHREALGAHPALTAAAPLRKAAGTERVSRLQSFTGAGWTGVLTDGEGRIVLGRRGDGPYMLADPDLLNDLAMAHPADAAAAVALVMALAGRQAVAFDVSLNGFGRSRDLLRSVFEPPLLGATLCAVATAGLIGLLSARRFGPVRRAERAIGAGKRALADNSAGLIALAGREAWMARPYADVVRRLAAGVTGAPRRFSREELDAYLDRAGAVRGMADRFSALVAEAEAVRDRGALMRVCGRLHRWRMGLVHGQH